MPRVFTGFFIGTSHNTLEPYNVLVRVYGKVQADYRVEIEDDDGKSIGQWYDDGKGTIDPKTGKDTTGNSINDLSNISSNAHAKMIVRGPSSARLSKTKAGPKTNKAGSAVYAMYAVDFMKRKVDQTVESIRAFNPVSVNLVGHSRGAIICIMIARELQKNSSIDCNLFLIDPVRQTEYIRTIRNFKRHAADKVFSDEDSLYIYPNTKDFKWIAMENQERGGLKKLFPFYKNIKRVDANGQPLAPTNTTNTNGFEADGIIRMPGSHGTATQCNPVQIHNSKVASLDDAIGEPIWPIGYTTELIMLRWLWQKAPVNNPTDFEILKSYSRIRAENQRDGIGKTTRNDIDISVPGQTQKVIIDNIQPSRDLNNLVGNPYYLSHYFVNQDHVNLVKKVLKAQMNSNEETSLDDFFKAVEKKPRFQRDQQPEVLISQDTDTLLNWYSRDSYHLLNEQIKFNII